MKLIHFFCLRISCLYSKFLVSKIQTGEFSVVIILEEGLSLNKGTNLTELSNDDKKKLKKLIQTVKQFHEIYETPMLLVQLPPEILIEDCQVSEKLYTCISMLRNKRERMFKALADCENIF